MPRSAVTPPPLACYFNNCYFSVFELLSPAVELLAAIRMGRAKKRLASVRVEETRVRVEETRVHVEDTRAEVAMNVDADPPALWMGGSSGNAENARNNSGHNSVLAHEDSEESIPPKKRGTSVLPDIWKIKKPEHRIVVKSNKLGQPVGRNAVQFSTIIGVLVKINCPLHYPNFPNVPDAVKLKMLGTLREKFKYPSVLNKWVQKAMSKKFRDRKSELKGIYFSPDESLSNNLNNCPKDVSVESWQFLVSYWMSEKGKKAEARAKRSRSQQKVTHTTGSKSFARFGEELEVESGEDPGRIAVYSGAHKKKDGSYSDPSAAEVVEKALAKKAEKGASKDDEVEILAEVLGNNRNGIVRGIGMGPTVSSVFGPFSSKEQGSHRDEEIEKLQTKMMEQSTEIDTLKSQVAQLLSIVSPPQATPPGVNLASSSHSSHRPARSQNPTTI